MKAKRSIIAVLAISLASFTLARAALLLLATTGLGANQSSGDPLFVDPANHDYHLQPGSPADFTRFIEQEIRDWAQVIRAANLTQ